MNYMVRKLDKAPTLDAVWDKPVWNEVPTLTLDNFMGHEPEHRPLTEFKVGYTDGEVHVISRVHDRYVRAIAENLHGTVCNDSCVEFFFAPRSTVGSGYFNVEINCAGVMLFHYQTWCDTDITPLKKEECDRVRIAHSIPGKVDPEISELTTWTVEYSLPIEILKIYFDVIEPAPGTTWRANFYKCADLTSHPHWLTWSEVDHPTPRFHVPESFGKLVFE